MIVRPIEERDHDGYFTAISLTYNNADPIPEERRKFRWHRAFVAEDQGAIQGVFSILDLTSTRGPALLRNGGVAGVAVLPDARRSGVGRRMMEYWVRQSREEGIALASLYAFSERYYRQFGYEVCGKRIKITCPADRLPQTSSDLPIRRLGPSDWRELDACFHQFAHARSGVSLRTENLWQRVLNEHRPLTIYAAGDPVESYVALSHSAAFWATDHISEVAWSTARGYDAIFGIFRTLAMNKKGLSWFEPSDSPFLSRHLDTFIETEVARPIMFRVCDVPLALYQIHGEGYDPFTIEVVDDLVPENRGPWRVSEGREGCGVERAESADIVLDIRQMAQALLGEPSLADLIRIGAVEVRNQGAVRHALTALPASPVYCPEFF